MAAAPTGKTAPKAKSPIESFKKLWEKDRKFIIQQLVLVTGFSGLLFFVFLPFLVKIHAMKASVKDVQNQIGVAQSKIEKIPELKQQLDRYGKELESVRKRFFEIKDLDQLVGNLSKLAANSGVLLVGSRPFDKPQGFPEPYQSKYLSVSYELTLEGSYHQFGKLLSDIEQSEQLLLIRDLTIRPNTGRQTEKLLCTIQVDAFVLAPQGL